MRSRVADAKTAHLGACAKGTVSPQDRQGVFPQTYPLFEPAFKRVQVDGRHLGTPARLLIDRNELCDQLRNPALGLLRKRAHFEIRGGRPGQPLRRGFPTSFAPASGLPTVRPFRVLRRTSKRSGWDPFEVSLVRSPCPRSATDLPEADGLADIDGSRDQVYLPQCNVVPRNRSRIQP
jgi:hypothetical protein